MQQTLMTIFAALGFILALLGWAYQLGYSNARLERNEKDINELREKSERSGESFRMEVRNSFSKLHEKLDGLPCHNPGWQKEKCQ